MNFAIKTTAAAFTAVLGLGLTTATANAVPAPQPGPGDKLGVQDSAPSANCFTKLTQGEGTEFCSVSDADGIAKISWKNGNGFSFSQSFGGCKDFQRIKNGIVSANDNVQTITVTGCNGVKKTISPS
ncbi:MAG: hypothetical protein ACT4QF_13470 [Sporichthyaceae bacterium]